MRRMVDDGMSRSVVNQNIGRIKRMFRWGVSQELIPADVAQSLWAVSGLRQGRSEARESTPVLPVADSIVEATIISLPEVVADMVRIERYTGCRPAEVCMMRPRDIDRTVEPWRYIPQSHKTAHRGRERVIFIGPQAQSILLRYWRAEMGIIASSRETAKLSGVLSNMRPAWSPFTVGIGPARIAFAARGGVLLAPATPLTVTAAPSIAPVTKPRWTAGRLTGCAIPPRQRFAGGSAWRPHK